MRREWRLARTVMRSPGRKIKSRGEVKTLTGNLYFALHDIDRSFFVKGIKWCTRTRVKEHFGIEPVRKHIDGSCLTEGRSSNDSCPYAVRL